MREKEFIRCVCSFVSPQVAVQVATEPIMNRCCVTLSFTEPPVMCLHLHLHLHLLACDFCHVSCRCGLVDTRNWAGGNTR
jgi:hypothetical protein